jgi:predicted transcriptional regulator
MLSIFNIEGSIYRVHFYTTQQNIFITSQPLEGVEIIFEGPQGISLQRTTGMSGMRVYAQLLKIIKKYITTYPVDMITFSAADKEMIPVYNMFYNKFLKSSFIRLSNTHFLSNKWIQDNKDDIPEDVINRINNISKEAESESNKEAESVKTFKNITRTAVGKLLKFKETYSSIVAIAYKIEELYNNEKTIKIMSVTPRKTLEDLVITKIEQIDNTPITNKEAIQFLQDFKEATKQNAFYRDLIPDEIWNKYNIEKNN